MTACGRLQPVATGEFRPGAACCLVNKSVPFSPRPEPLALDSAVRITIAELAQFRVHSLEISGFLCVIKW